MKKLPEEAAFEPERMPTSMSMQEGIDMNERNKAIRKVVDHVLDTKGFYVAIDPDALDLFRDIAKEGNGHDMAPVNKNTLMRLVGTIDELAIRALSTPGPQDRGLADEWDKMARSQYTAENDVHMVQVIMPLEKHSQISTALRAQEKTDK